MDSRKFYIGLLTKDGEAVGHAFSPTPRKFSYPELAAEKPAEAAPKPPSLPPPDTFESVFDSFVATMESYRDFMSLTLGIMPHLAEAIADRQIGAFVKAHGTKRNDLSEDNSEVYELDRRFLGQFTARNDFVESAMRGIRILPEVVIVGLISAYDGFLASLLKVVINLHQETVFTSEKEITFKDLLNFSSIEDAKSALIEREIGRLCR